MSKRLLVGVAVISFALLGTTFAGVENIKVSGDMTAQGISRDLSLGDDGNTLDREGFIFSQIRLRFDADLTENVAATLSLINERLWGDEDVEDAYIDLDLACVELKEFLYQPLTLIVGRQNLRYGSGLIVGDPDTNQNAVNTEVPQAIRDLSLRKSFDAVRAILDYSPYTLDLIYAKTNEGGTNVDDDITLWGANLAYQWDSYNGVTEVYLFDSQTRWGLQADEDQDKTSVMGVRTQFDLNDNLTLGGELAFQWGDSHTDTDNDGDGDQFEDRDAMAILANAEYKLLDDYNTKIGVSYAFLSGDDDFDDSGHTGWDPMFEDQAPGEIINILCGSSNAHIFTISGSLMPREDLIVGALYVKSVLAEKWSSTDSGNYRPLVGPAGGATGTQVYAVERDDTDFGDELDAYLIYDYTEDVQFKVNTAWFIPGSFFTSANDNAAYSLRAGLTVSF